MTTRPPALRALLRLVRWPGVLTAAVDAATAAWMFTPCAPPPLLAATGAAALLYAGGVVLNDVADARRDEALHPDRPIPSGEVRRGTAALFGISLLVSGLGLALLAGPASAAAFGGVALAILAYDLVLKRGSAVGAVGMGLCRGGSALAAALSSAAFRDAVSAVPARAWIWALPWFVHAAAVTAASLLEESSRRRLLAPWAAAGIVTAPALGAVLLGLRNDPGAAWAVLPWGLLAFVVGTRVAAIRSEPTPATVGALVREGVFGFLLLDATLLAARGRPIEALVAIALWALVRRLLARRRS